MPGGQSGLEVDVMADLREIWLWLRVFIVSFIVVVLFRYWLEAQISYDHNWSSIALSALLVAIAIATAQWVLRPRPKPARAEPAQYVLPPAPPPPPMLPAPRRAAAKKRKARKARRR